MFIQAIQLTRYSRGKTNLAAALRTMRDMFRPGDANRPDAPDFAILASDGQATLDKDQVRLALRRIVLSCRIQLFAMQSSLSGYLISFPLLKLRCFQQIVACACESHCRHTHHCYLNLWTWHQIDHPSLPPNRCA